MIVSHSRRFIFVKTKKTAGTSLEIALSGLCGEDDVITPISATDEAERQRLGLRGPQNCRLGLRHYRSPDVLRLLLHGQPLSFYNHTPALEVRRLLPSKVWNGYFKFCFDRNPWDKIVSHYHWQGGESRFGDIETFLRSGRGQPYSNYQLYSIRGLVAVDRVYRYEELDSALEDISHRLELDERIRMPFQRAKGGYRPDSLHYRDSLTREQAELIAVMCAREIRLLGYEY